MAWHLVRWTDAAEVPWRNGGGVTRELVVHGGDPFEWRLSAATIDRDGPFSEFAGVDRVLVLLRGRGVSLDIGGALVRLESPGAGVAFAGEARVGSRLIDGPTVDLNLMTRRDLLKASWSVVPAHEWSVADEVDVTVAHVLDGDVAADGSVLAVGDTVWWESVGNAPVITGTGSLVRFGLTRRC